MERGTIVRRALGGGRWFPGRSGELLDMVNGYLDGAEVPPLEGRIVGGMAPHAGFIYSGVVAGYTFRAIRENAAAGHRPDTVVVLGFCHRGGARGVALMDGDCIQTPLRQTALDRAAAEVLVASGHRIRFDYAPHAGEHSAENQLPFLQAVLPDTPVVVALMGDHEEETIGDLVGGLMRLDRDRRVLVIASTDLLHDADYERVSRTDRHTMEQVEALDHAGILRRWSGASQVCCGIGPVMTLMRYVERKGVTKGTVLHYRNSGDDFPESRGNWVVGYGAAVFLKPET